MGKIQDVTIKLTVAAKRLYEIGEAATNAEVDKLSLLSDDNYGKYENGIDAVDFVSNVYENNKLILTGESLDKGFSVIIQDYVPKSNPSKIIDISSKMEVVTGPKQRVEYGVKADAKEAMGANDEDYKIQFTIKDAMGNGKIYSIDPKLRPNN
jgi:hypothetical protein